MFHNRISLIIRSSIIIDIIIWINDVGKNEF